ncbi:MAG: TIGR01244 family phosphatase [Natronospirillum sp.]|uniref:TIGR01244 family sulfur transferase n=1 Tax=Natronospirillum sp. TaxID=2812955 RepID=UPI0025F183F7|nr:TIGR01244 family sulfur transferase [Natronospirillum sp.]MCH8552869.1 TIGR01244 family phosphatase [Natronospirillum sp.]
MKYQALSPHYAIAPQINPQDVATIKTDGFGIVICNRPDGEEQGQPTADSIRQACAEAGLEFLHCPMNGPETRPDDVARLQKLLQGDSRILAFCRTGNRSSIFYQKATE